MGKKDIGRFTAAIKKDAALMAEVKKVSTDAGKVIQLAKAKGFDFTEAELKKYVEAKKGKLSEEQLKKVAGGSVIGVVTAVVAVAVETV